MNNFESFMLRRQAEEDALRKAPQRSAGADKPARRCPLPECGYFASPTPEDEGYCQVHGRNLRSWKNA